MPPATTGPLMREPILANPGLRQTSSRLEDSDTWTGRWAMDPLEESATEAKLGGNNAVTARLCKTKMCYFFERGKCASANCRYAHTQDELRSQPNLTKTKLCRNWADGRCREGQHCPYAHGETELRVTEGIYKTQMCHFFAKGRCLKGDRCNHAHGPKDLRVLPAADAADGAPSPPGVSVGLQACSADGPGGAPLHTTVGSPTRAGNSGKTPAPRSVGSGGSGGTGGGREARSPHSPLPLADLLSEPAPQAPSPAATAAAAAAALQAQFLSPNFGDSPGAASFLQPPGSQQPMHPWGISVATPGGFGTDTPQTGSSGGTGTVMTPLSFLQNGTPSPASRAVAEQAAQAAVVASAIANNVAGAIATNILTSMVAGYGAQTTLGVPSHSGQQMWMPQLNPLEQHLQLLDPSRGCLADLQERMVPCDLSQSFAAMDMGCGPDFAGGSAACSTAAGIAEPTLPEQATKPPARQMHRI